MRLLYEADDLGQERVRADPSGANPKQAFFVDCRADHRVANRLFHRDGFPGGNGFVQMTRAVDDLSVCGHLGAGPNDHDVANPDLRDRHFHLGAVFQQRRGLGTEGDELADGLGRTPLGAGFEIAPDQMEGHDGRRHFYERRHRVNESNQPDEIRR